MEQPDSRKLYLNVGRQSMSSVPNPVCGAIRDHPPGRVRIAIRFLDLCAGSQYPIPSLTLLTENDVPNGDGAPSANTYCSVELHFPRKMNSLLGRRSSSTLMGCSSPLSKAAS